MKKTAIKIFRVLGFVIPALLIFIVLFCNAFDWNLARPLIGWASQKFSFYELRISGDLKFHLGRNLEVSLEDFHVKPRDYPEGVDNFFTAKRFFLRIPIMSLFGDNKV